MQLAKLVASTPMLALMSLRETPDRRLTAYVLSTDIGKTVMSVQSRHCSELKDRVFRILSFVCGSTGASSLIADYSKDMLQLTAEVDSRTTYSVALTRRDIFHALGMYKQHDQYTNAAGRQSSISSELLYWLSAHSRSCGFEVKSIRDVLLPDVLLHRHYTLIGAPRGLLQYDYDQVTFCLPLHRLDLSGVKSICDGLDRDEVFIAVDVTFMRLRRMPSVAFRIWRIEVWRHGLELHRPPSTVKKPLDMRVTFTCDVDTFLLSCFV